MPRVLITAAHCLLYHPLLYLLIIDHWSLLPTTSLTNHCCLLQNFTPVMSLSIKTLLKHLQKKHQKEHPQTIHSMIHPGTEPSDLFHLDYLIQWALVWCWMNSFVIIPLLLKLSLPVHFYTYWSLLHTASLTDHSWTFHHLLTNAAYCHTYWSLLHLLTTAALTSHCLTYWLLPYLLPTTSLTNHCWPLPHLLITFALRLTYSYHNMQFYL